MIGTLISALIGAEVDESEGGSGTAGAAEGMAAWWLVKKLVPLAVIGVGALVAKHYLEKLGGKSEPG